MRRHAHLSFGLIVGFAALAVVSALRAPVGDLSDAVALAFRSDPRVLAELPDLVAEAPSTGIFATALNLIGAMLAGALAFSSGPLGVAGLVWARLGRAPVRSAAVLRAVHLLTIWQVASAVLPAVFVVMSVVEPSSTVTEPLLLWCAIEVALACFALPAWLKILNSGAAAASSLGLVREPA
jgi:hypothetical protein